MKKYEALEMEVVKFVTGDAAATELVDTVTASGAEEEAPGQQMEKDETLTKQDVLS